MEKALEFLRSHIEVAFATVENEKPRIRVFQIMKQEGTTLYFATAPHKEVFKQLQTNPNVELLAMEDNISVRLSGKADFTVSDELSQVIYHENAVLPRLYPSCQALVYFKIQVEQIDYYDLTFTPPLFEHYDL